MERSYYDPYLDDSFNVNKGLYLARELSNINQIGLLYGYGALDILPQFSDLLVGSYEPELSSQFIDKWLVSLCHWI